jgi:hypothetical protein
MFKGFVFMSFVNTTLETKAVLGNKWKKES